MEYNSQREKLKISDYGRNVYKLIAYAKSVEDKEQRTKIAESIVGIMAMVNPRVREQSEWHRKLWGHLMVLSNGELDVNCPYEFDNDKSIRFAPLPMTYRSSSARYRHYGVELEQMIQKVSQMPEGEEKTALSEMIAHTMKRHYLTWNRDTVDDETVLAQLDELSGGGIKLRDNFEFNQDYTVAPQAVYNAKRKKKKKKN